jgi:F0F1-type ATP synthase membrane subunit a
VIFVQELLVSLIQALVFPLLIAIFIKVAKSAE